MILICCHCALAFLCARIYVEIRQLQVRACERGVRAVFYVAAH